MARERAHKKRNLNASRIGREQKLVPTGGNCAMTSHACEHKGFPVTVGQLYMICCMVTCTKTKAQGRGARSITKSKDSESTSTASYQLPEVGAGCGFEERKGLANRVPQSQFLWKTNFTFHVPRNAKTLPQTNSIRGHRMQYRGWLVLVLCCSFFCCWLRGQMDSPRYGYIGHWRDMLVSYVLREIRYIWEPHPTSGARWLANKEHSSCGYFHAHARTVCGAEANQQPCQQPLSSRNEREEQAAEQQRQDRGTPSNNPPPMPHTFAAFFANCCEHVHATWLCTFATPNRKT